MSARATKSSKKPKVLPLGISADGLSISQAVHSRGASTVRSTNGGSDYDDDEDDDGDERGRSSSSRTRGSWTTVVKRLTSDGTNLTAPLSPSSTRSGSSLGQVGKKGEPKLLKVKDCLNKMMEFVKAHDLKRILGEDLTDKQLRQQLLPQAEIAARLPINLKYVNRELVMQLAILSLYDLAVLIDDSISMEFEEAGKRKVAVKSVLSFIADIYGAVSDKKRGIRAIRFLNGNDDLEADNIMTAEEIDKVIDNHEFEGLTRIGTGLMQKILKPFVFDDTVKWEKKSGEARKLKQLGRPLLIMVITDGAVEGEPSSRLKQAIQSVADSLKRDNFDPKTTKAIAFQFARVGNDRDAKKFLEHLDNKSTVKDYVDTLSGGDLMEIMGMRSKDPDYKLTEKHQRRAIKLLLGPINSKYDEMESKEKKSKPSLQDTGYNSSDDFNDEEDEEEDFDDDDDDDEDEDEDEDDDDEEEEDDDDNDSSANQKQTNQRQKQVNQKQTGQKQANNGNGDYGDIDD